MKKHIVYMKGTEMTVEGAKLKIGDKAPVFSLTDMSLKSVTLEDFHGKIIILSCVPSIDTSTCSLETARFNKEAEKLAPQAVVITVSKDLPFAQARWCAANEVKNIVMLSDYKNGPFANDYGVFLPDMGLLARAIFIIDKKGIIQYIQFVEEISEEPDYISVLNKVKEMIK